MFYLSAKQVAWILKNAVKNGKDGCGLVSGLLLVIMGLVYPNTGDRDKLREFISKHLKIHADELYPEAKKGSEDTTTPDITDAVKDILNTYNDIGEKKEDDQ